MRTLLVLLCLVMPANAQVEFDPIFEPERVDRFRIEATLELEQEGEEAGEPRRLTQTVDVRLTTAQVDPSGRAIISLAVERVDVELTRGDSIERFVWPDAPDDSDSDLADTWSKLVGDVLRLYVEPDGRIGAIAGAEALSERFQMGAPDAVSSLGLFAPDSLERTLRPIWGFELSGEPRTPDESWQIAERRVISGQRHIRLTREYALDDHDGDGVAVAFSTTIQELPVRSPTQIVVTIDGNGNGSTTWDTRQGITDVWREESTIVIEASLQDTDPITTHLHRQVTLTRLQAE